MKLFYLLLNRLKQYYLRNKLLFLLFVLGGAINTIAVIYSYGNLMPLVANRNSQEAVYRCYHVSFDATPAEEESLELLRTNPLIESFVIYQGNGIGACAGIYPLVKLSGTLEFTQPYQVILPQTANKFPGQEMEFDGKLFEVIGTAGTGLGGVYLIPYNTYMELGYGASVNRIVLYAVSRQDWKDDQVVALINDIFPNNTGVLSDADMMHQLEKKTTVEFLGLIVINAFLSALAYTFLLYYILDSLEYDNGVCLILGATKARVTAFILREAIILSVLSNGIGLAVHRLLYDAVFTNLNITPDLQYTVGDYCFVYLIMLVLSLLTALPLIIKGCRLSPVAFRQSRL